MLLLNAPTTFPYPGPSIPDVRGNTLLNLEFFIFLLYFIPLLYILVLKQFMVEVLNFI